MCKFRRTRCTNIFFNGREGDNNIIVDFVYRHYREPTFISQTAKISPPVYKFLTLHYLQKGKVEANANASRLRKSPKLLGC